MKKSFCGLMAFCAVGLFGATMYSCSEREEYAVASGCDDSVQVRCDTMACGRITVNEIYISSDSTIEVGSHEFCMEKKSVAFLRGAQACEHDWDDVDLYYCAKCKEYYIGRDTYCKPRNLNTIRPVYASMRR